MNKPDGDEITEIRDIIAEKFTESDWLELGLKVDDIENIQRHDRLLRGLKWGNSDYKDCVTKFVIRYARDEKTWAAVKRFVNKQYGDSAGGINIGDKDNPVIVKPKVFRVPSEPQRKDLVAVMMPFTEPFEAVYEAIEQACMGQFLVSKRASDIWDNSEVVQDIFGLIYTSQVVICDFTGKNPNVFYEAGIAHTLGREVVPLTQHKGDIPFDVIHHRYIEYLNNGEGLEVLKTKIVKRLEKIALQ